MVAQVAIRMPQQCNRGLPILLACFMQRQRVLDKVHIEQTCVCYWHIGGFAVFDMVSRRMQEASPTKTERTTRTLVASQQPLATERRHSNAIYNKLRKQARQNHVGVKKENLSALIFVLESDWISNTPPFSLSGCIGRKGCGTLIG